MTDKQTTLIAHGSLDRQDEFPFAITKLEDDNDPNRSQARVRMYHAAAGAPDIDVLLDSSILDYTELTEYQDIAEGPHVVAVRDTRSGEQIISPTTIPFDDETIVNLYFAGTNGATTDRLTMIVAIDIETGIRDFSSSSSAS
eukprot:CAMPEP_0206208984 /NCGR_PEP_ID=MMETSP0166-20121206/16617_1 /ASSEMBLY_ACC=CAM_ASM_000260 /TAXON_ID=95228 /ORGANISM="Vannella robusta, Strain DIVA3 518/3/11/1/6" /LENGTH=141 /DNA_ID=CAMNT_0053630251 /DNA_START=187 /DNA_END=609 /DNA_ORIENTATION=-